ncbi:dihydropteroate synthase [Ignatzschineria sp. LJL83]
MNITFNQKTLDLSQPKIMGILNLTPNSFSDGGDYFDPEKALDRAYEMIEDGADILDIGAESTNPKADPITSDEETARLLPVIQKLRKHLDIPISIDTFRAKTMAIMVQEGIDIINDVTALSDEGSLEVLINSNVAIVLMHMLGNHEKMHIDGNLEAYYQSQGGITNAVKTKIQEKAELCLEHGIEASRIILDPGFGFDKSQEDQLLMLHELEQLTTSPFPYLVGVSRKRLIGAVTQVDNAKDRLAGNLAVALWSIQKGAKILRVHDVKATKEAFLMWEAMQSAK